MSFEWLQMRITEEKERRARERSILDRMPRALEELRATLTDCVETYNKAFGADSASLRLEAGVIYVTAGAARIEVATDLTLPGFRIEGGSHQLLIQVGMLPGDKLFYKDEDKYLTAEEMTKRILDRALFPKLTE